MVILGTTLLNFSPQNYSCECLDSVCDNEDWMTASSRNSFDTKSGKHIEQDLLKIRIVLQPFQSSTFQETEY